MRSGRFRVAATLALLAVGVPASAQRAKRPLLDLAHAKVVDLSYAFDDRTLYWPTSPAEFQLKVLHHGATPAGFFYAANTFCAPPNTAARTSTRPSTLQSTAVRSTRSPSSS